MPEPDTFDPVAGVAFTLAPGLRRILAPNPSPMTYRGTNTYLIGTRGIAVIDPGPDNLAHMDAILAALEQGQSITHILITHAHLDHSPLARPLAAVTGAPILAFGNAVAGRSPMMQRLAAGGMIGGGEGVDGDFAPDVCLADGEWIVGDGWQIKALWTPGHFCNHLCFAWNDAVFTGDLVMGWASSLVSPPDGDLTQFMTSCMRLMELGASVLHPGHGAPVTDAASRLDWLIAHRQMREREVLAQLSKAPATAAILARAIYTSTPARLMPAATRNVLAHLIDLHGRGRLHVDGSLNAEATFVRLDIPHAGTGVH
ncbi:MBL fold metallo-hydrolase [Roseovarius arcticus]|uniref:MBL fold metallo-hydrolase n=1 Tax=Roseovarius arcticus TaxID=2547404 RepID=UPI0014866E81|nr:MBL fold metallo-hydrolase [Roseovarius arcticus]